eukprot:jgi/Mesvir1/1292/Mv03759-RA.1
MEGEVPLAAPLEAADRQPEPLIEYLKSVVPPILAGKYESFSAYLQDSTVVATLVTFMNDPDKQTLAVHRIPAGYNDAEAAGENEAAALAKSAAPLVGRSSMDVSVERYRLELSVTFTGRNVGSVAFIKRGPVIDSTRPVATQLHTMVLSTGDEGVSPFEALHAYVHSSITPYFQSYTTSVHKKFAGEGTAKDRRLGIPSTRRKLEELDVSLRQCQDNVEIPRVVLAVDPDIKAIAAKCKAQGVRLRVEDLGEMASDPHFLNSLQKGLNRWILEIQKVTRLQRDASSGTALQELSFWGGLEHALGAIEQQLNTPEIELTLAILKQARRFHATKAFETETGLREARERVSVVNHLVKDFPIHELLSVTEIEQMMPAMAHIASHMRRRLPALSTLEKGSLLLASGFDPIRRSMQVLDALTRDIGLQLVRAFLEAKKVMELPFEAFRLLAEEMVRVQEFWEEQVGQLRRLATDLSRRRGADRHLPPMQSSLAPLRDRLRALLTFRTQHAKLRLVIGQVLPATDPGAARAPVIPSDLAPSTAGIPSSSSVTSTAALSELEDAYSMVCKADLLDTSKEGQDAWEGVMGAYDAKVDHVERLVVATMRRALDAAVSANEMFGIFQRYNVLFFRPRIRGAIQEYQSRLMKTVKDDIAALQDKFRLRYEGSQAHSVSDLRDIPPVSGAILWAKNFDRRLSSLMHRVEIVLGDVWEQHMEGQKLKRDFENFSRKLNVQEIFDAWVRDTEAIRFDLSGPIFEIMKRLVGGEARLVLDVRFDPRMLQLFKEVRNLLSLGFRVPYAIESLAEEGRRMYSAVVMLTECLRRYHQVCSRLERGYSADAPKQLAGGGADAAKAVSDDSAEKLALLVARQHAHVQAVIAEGVSHLYWESDELDPYVARLLDAVSAFDEKVAEVSALHAAIERELVTLETCPHEVSLVTEAVANIQRLVDQLSLASCSNMKVWSSELDARVERALASRVEAALSLWVGYFEDMLASCLRTMVADGGHDQPTPLASWTQGTNLDSRSASSKAPAGSWKGGDRASTPALDWRTLPCPGISPQLAKWFLWSDLMVDIAEREAAFAAQGEPADGPGGAGDARGRLMRTSSRAMPVPRQKLPKGLVPTDLVLEIRLRDNELFVEPPLEVARAAWLSQLHRYIGFLLDVQRVKHSRYDTALGGGGGGGPDDGGNDMDMAGGGGGGGTGDGAGSSRTYADLLGMVQPSLLQRAYAIMEAHLRMAAGYVASWLACQAALDMQGAGSMPIDEASADDLEAWKRLLASIREAKNAFDGPETSARFGIIVVEVGGTQAKLSYRYDGWHREVLGKFAARLGVRVERFYAAISTSKREMEGVDLAAPSTAVAVESVTLLHRLRRGLLGWGTELETLQQGQAILEQQRFTLPANWRFVEMCAGEWDALVQLTKRRERELTTQMPQLQRRVQDEGRSLATQAGELLKSWETSCTPIRGGTGFGYADKADKVTPAAALDQLTIMEGQVTRLSEEVARLSNAREALELDDVSGGVAGGSGFGDAVARLAPVGQEIALLKEMWAEAARGSDKLDSLRAIAWPAVVPREVRTKLEELAKQLDAAPSRVRQHAAFTLLREQVSTLLGPVHWIVTELKSEAMRDRHWRKVAARLRLGATSMVPAGVKRGVTTSDMSSLTLGNIWDADLVAHEHALKEVIVEAQGEVALERFLAGARDMWGAYRLELVKYQNKCWLIKGWDELFAVIQEHVQSLSSMRASPYFTVFEEDAAVLEDALTKGSALFDVWIQVQRRWVYLEGVFTGSAEIQHQLPSEYSRFRAGNSELMSLMKVVYRSPLVSEVAAIPDVHATMERLAASLERIQKSLSEYLERQRGQFPRFYFVGDEDVLEMLGSSRNPVLLQKHVKKMFAGISVLGLITTGVAATPTGRTDAPGGGATEGAAPAPAEEQQQAVGTPEAAAAAATAPSEAIAQLLQKAVTADSSVVGLFERVISPEGEEVALANPVILRASSQVYSWLQDLESSVQATLAKQVVSAAEQLRLSAKASKAAVAAGTGANHADSPWAFHGDDLSTWMDTWAAQVMLLASQALWTEATERAITAEQGGAAEDLPRLVQGTEASLGLLARHILHDLAVLHRKKLEALITELVHQRDVGRKLISDKVTSETDFGWLYFLRVYQQIESGRPAQLRISIADASFFHGYEYSGVGERLVQTPLTDRIFLTLTQALKARMGGSPFGPAGTGKTETVKALGVQLGRAVIVFNCDASFDHRSMTRIFSGLCHTGAWGCFDEFNRLAERILSAVSEQILNIQRGLEAGAPRVQILGAAVPLHPNTGIFVTMNPGYAGRSNLPDNLKLLFRNVAMVRPDQELISQVMLFGQGFQTAEVLAAKVVPLFQLCKSELSAQPHYDFGLRALKSVLASSGAIQRRLAQTNKGQGGSPLAGSPTSGAPPASQQEVVAHERLVLIQSVRETIMPKLVAEDIPVLEALLRDVFPGASLPPVGEAQLTRALLAVCRERGLVGADHWVDKVLQLYGIQKLHHGVMMVGASGSGKSTAWRALLQALSVVEGIKGKAHVIDPKALSKEELYGTLDVTTREWRDGVFTSILRKIIDNIRGERNELVRHWIVFDGDVDPVWVENLNSVLDDNKLLTLPSGERLVLPSNVRIMFEVHDLRHATLATVSRCGMVWFSPELVTPRMVLAYFCRTLRGRPLSVSTTSSAAGGAAGTLMAGGALDWASGVLAGATGGTGAGGSLKDALDMASPEMVVQRQCVDVLAPLLFGRQVAETVHVAEDGRSVQGHYSYVGGEELVPASEVVDVCHEKKKARRRTLELEGVGAAMELPPALAGASIVERALAVTRSLQHVMEFTEQNALGSALALLAGAVGNVLEYFECHPDFPMTEAQVRSYLGRQLLLALLWGLGGTLAHAQRIMLSRVLEALAREAGIPLPADLGGPSPTMRSGADAGSGVDGGAMGKGMGPADSSRALLDYNVSVETCDWRPWVADVPTIDVDASLVMVGSAIIPTVDTVRQSAILDTWLRRRRPFILCGPPGVGKTMLLESSLNCLPSLELLTLNFSSTTTPETLLRAVEQRCSVKRTPKGGLVMQPLEPEPKWLCVFCDEINLPTQDTYATQRVNSFLRQLIEHGGFWRPSDRAWVHLERVQFVGACNPPTDAGRVPLSPRFLRHTPVLAVDFPSTESLLLIYSTFNRVLGRGAGSLAAASFGYGRDASRDATGGGAPTLPEDQVLPVTHAMVDVYNACRTRFTPEAHPHYIYSPRELTRWVRSLHTSLAQMSGVSTAPRNEPWWQSDDAATSSSRTALRDLIQVWAHLGHRLFCDRLVDDHERSWVTELLEQAASEHFPAADHSWLHGPLFFSAWLGPRMPPASTSTSTSSFSRAPRLSISIGGGMGTSAGAAPNAAPAGGSGHYRRVDPEELRAYVTARLRVFNEEELNVPLVVFDEMLDYVLRIDHVLRQPLGHLLLIGASGVGKTVLSRFVAWMNGLSLFQIRAHRRYTGASFDDDLRALIRRAGCKGERICFVLDEANMLEPSFLERLNALLASGMVPGLFDDDDFTAVLHACREGAAADGIILGDSHEQLYKHFVMQVQANLHVVFTMNPASDQFRHRTTSSPALFNRCVVNWFGNWSENALRDVGKSFIESLDLYVPADPTARPRAVSIDTAGLGGMASGYSSAPSSPRGVSRGSMSTAFASALSSRLEGDATSPRRGSVSITNLARMSMSRGAMGAGSSGPLSPRGSLNGPSAIERLAAAAERNFARAPISAPADAITSTVVDILVLIHESAQRACAELGAQVGHEYAITPRHYLDMVKHVIALHREKREEVEAQQLHVTGGLDKIRLSEHQLNDMKLGLERKTEELREKTRLANEKLARMVADQREAEAQREASLSISAQLTASTYEIESRKEGVMQQLREVEPAVAEAKASVRSIKKAHLDDLRSMPNPPEAVKLTLQAVCLMLTETKIGVWREILGIVRKNDFISLVVDFNNERLSPAIVSRLKAEYVGNPMLNYEAVNRASKACGPLCQWITSQIAYLEIMGRVQPLRDQVARLVEESGELQREMERVELKIHELEESIARYSEEYKALIAETEHIKLETNATAGRIDRATALISSLLYERQRWEDECAGFRTQMGVTVGNVLLSAGFLTYLGLFDERNRRLLVRQWMAALGSQDDVDRGNAIMKGRLVLPHSPLLSFVEYLTRPGELAAWSACGLSEDQLSIENAVIMARFNRYPVVIDPSGKAVAFMMERFMLQGGTTGGNRGPAALPPSGSSGQAGSWQPPALRGQSSSSMNPSGGSSSSSSTVGGKSAQKGMRTSFLEDSFLKTLESALRFGCPLLVEDVENLDPVLSPVLNQEYHRTGGRRLVRIGDQDIDVSPSFSLFLTTRDPLPRFSPDLCGRVTIINFTVTPSGLTSQCLDRILQVERSDVDTRRRAVLRARGEFKVRLRELEQMLLNALSGSQGSLLEDDSIVRTLTSLKHEAEEVSRQVADTESVMADVEAVRNLYSPLASAASAIFFTLELLPTLHFLCQISLDSFLHAFEQVLSGATPDAKGTDATGAPPLLPPPTSLGADDSSVHRRTALARVEQLTDALFAAVFQRASMAMLHQHRVALALRLAQIRVATAELMRRAGGGETVMGGREASGLVAADWALLLQVGEGTAGASMWKAMKSKWSRMAGLGGGGGSAPGSPMASPGGPPAREPLSGLKSKLSLAQRERLMNLLDRAVSAGSPQGSPRTTDSPRGSIFAASMAANHGGTASASDPAMAETVLAGLDMEAVLQSEPEAWAKFLKSSMAEACIPAINLAPVPQGRMARSSMDDGVAAGGTGGRFDPEVLREKMRQLLILCALRPDRAIFGAALFADHVLGGSRRGGKVQGIVAAASGGGDEGKLVSFFRSCCSSSRPLIMASAPGYDVSQRVDMLASATGRGKGYTSLAMGPAEGYPAAEQAIRACAKSGDWVLLKNIHLATAEWLSSLEGRLHRLGSRHPDFRLLLTMEISPVVPPQLLRVGAVVLFEPPVGVKASLERSLAVLQESGVGGTGKGGSTQGQAGGKEEGVAASAKKQPPKEASRLFFLVAWLHAVVQERLRYLPIGWSHAYDFSEAEERAGLAAVTSWLASAAAGAAHIAPENVPWDALRTLLEQALYGGRLDNEWDARALRSFVKTLFVPQAYDLGFCVASARPGMAGQVFPRDRATMGGAGASSGGAASGGGSSDSDMLLLPDGTSFDALLQWVETLPSSLTPAWLGLPRNVELLRLTQLGQAVLRDLAKLQGTGEVDAPGEGMLRGGNITPPGPTSPTFSDVSNATPKARGPEGGLLSAVVSASSLLRRMQDWSSRLGKPSLQALLAHVSEKQQAPGACGRLPDELAHPLVICMEREIEDGAAILAKVTRDLADGIAVNKGSRLGWGASSSISSTLRSILRCVARDEVPPQWGRRHKSCVLSLGAWMTDLERRLHQLASLARAMRTAAAKPGGSGAEAGSAAAMAEVLWGSEVWLGGLFRPDAFVTATRQAAARVHGWPLERLELCCRVEESGGAGGGAASPDSAEGSSGGGSKRGSRGGAQRSRAIVLTGLSVECATWNEGQLTVAEDELSLTEGHPLHRVSLWWQLREEGLHMPGSPRSSVSEPSKLVVPVYLNREREHFLFALSLPVDSSIPPSAWHQRGVAVMLWGTHGQGA